MGLHQREKLKRGHLKGNGDILIGIHHDHIILLVHRVQKSPAVIGEHRHILRQIKILSGQLCDFLVYLHSLQRHSPVILPALHRICTRAHTQNQSLTLLWCLSLHHQRRRHGIVIVHPCEPLILHVYGLHAEKHVGGEDHAAGALLNLQIIVDRLPLIGQILLPEGEAAGKAGHAAEQKTRRGCRNPLLPAACTDEIQNRQHKENPRKDQKCNGSAHGRNRHESGDKGSYDTSHRVECSQISHNSPAVLQTAHGVLRQRGGHRSQ